MASVSSDIPSIDIILLGSPGVGKATFVAYGMPSVSGLTSLMSNF
jgi:hypothetical protein